MTERFAVYFRDQGWLVDSGVGGTFSFDVTQCCEWPSAERALEELVACNLLDGYDPTTRSHLQTWGVYFVRVS